MGVYYVVMPARVLVVDDDASIRGLITSVLIREGLNIDVATNGQEAIDKMRQTEYAVVVLDLMMPRISGYDLLKAIEDAGSRSACVVIISAASEKVIDSVASSSVRAKLRKPFNISELVTAVKSCFPSDDAP